jgi:hypothetical protein
MNEPSKMAIDPERYTQMAESLDRHLENSVLAFANAYRTNAPQSQQDAMFEVVVGAHKAIQMFGEVFTPRTEDVT